MNKVCVLQLDTKFPRIPGDVACHETFVTEIRVVKIRKAHVNNIVLGIPEDNQFIKFEKEIRKSNEQLIITNNELLIHNLYLIPQSVYNKYFPYI